MVIARNLSKTYKEGNLALHDINFLIEKGEFVFLVGASGSGKTTLVKMFLREEIPSQGEFFINNIDVAKLSRREIPYFRRNVGVVFQDFRLLPDKTVYENIEFAMIVVGTPRRIRRKRVPAVLMQVGLSGKSKAYPNQLSGGEKQRVAIARAIVNNPSVLIADEPTGNLDPDNSWEIMNLLDEINKKGTTVVVASHAKEIVDAMKKRVIVLEHGRIVRDEEKGVYGNETESN